MDNDSYDFIMALPSEPEERAWLQARLETLTVKESLILSAALMKTPAQNGGDAIRVFMSLPDYAVCCSAGSYEQLGRFSLCHEMKLPEQIPNFIDMEQLGKNYEDEHSGLFIGNCYVEYPNQEPTICYDGTNLTACADNDWSVKLKLASEKRPKGVWLKLPDYSDANDGKPDEIRIALDELGVKTVDECTLLDAKCVLPGIENPAEPYNRISDLIYDGQNLGFVLDERGQGMGNFMELYGAALEYENCTRLDAALDIAEQLSRYEYVPMDGLREYAEQDLQNQGVTLPETISRVFDYEKYAANLLEQQGFSLNRNKTAYVNKDPSQCFKGMTIE